VRDIDQPLMEYEIVMYFFPAYFLTTNDKAD
jgi:hypothetical protein